MKTIAIDTGAAWAATLSYFQDGDIFRESNIDIMIDAISDRLGYLKTTVDGKASLAAANTWTDAQTIAPSGGGGQVALTLWRNLQFVSRATDANESLIAGIKHRIERFNDANQTLTVASEILLVPTLTGNRVYTINNPHLGVDGRVVRIVRPGTAAFTATVNDTTGTLFVIPSGQSGWATIVYDGSSASGAWVVLERSANLTSVSTNV